MFKKTTNFAPINIIVINAPTANKEHHDVERLHEQFISLTENTKRNGVKIILGVINAKIGQGIGLCYHEHLQIA